MCCPLPFQGLRPDLDKEGSLTRQHLGKSFPLHNGQRQTFLVPGGLFLKSFLWDWKTFLNSRSQALGPTMEPSFERGSELKINFISTPFSPQCNSHIFGKIYGSLLSQKAFPSWELVDPWMKPTMPKGKEQRGILITSLAQNCLKPAVTVPTKHWAMALGKADLSSSPQQSWKTSCFDFHFTFQKIGHL